MQDRRVAGFTYYTMLGHQIQDSFSANARQFQRTIKHSRNHPSPYSTCESKNLGHDQGSFVMTKNPVGVWTSAG